MRGKSLTVAWFSFFPVEWLEDVPEYVRNLPKLHPAPWQQVLLAELEKDPTIKLHVIVLRKQFDRDHHFERRGVHFHLLKTCGGLRSTTLFWHDTLRIRAALKTIQPDVVHAWGTENGAALVASRLGYPSVVTVQGLMSRMAELFPVNVYERLAGWLERVSLARASLVTAESKFSAQFVRERFSRAKVRQIELAPADQFHHLTRRPQLDPLRLLLATSILSHRKGVDLALKALDGLCPEIDFELHLMGAADEACLRSVRAETSTALWQRVQLLHHASPSQVAAEMSEAVLLLCPTRADTGPMVAKEAAVAGVPVVGSRVGGIPDYISEGENGLLFPDGDLAACTAAIRAALQHPLFGRGEVSPAALERVRAYLSPARMGEAFVRTYLEAGDLSGGSLNSTLGDNETA